MAQFSQPQNSIFASSSSAAARPPPGYSPQVASPPSSKAATPTPPTLQQQQKQQVKRSDPFAALNTPPRQASPFQFSSSTHPPAPSSSSGGLDLLGLGNGASSAMPAAAQQDDEWEFSSSLPADQPAQLVVTNGEIKIDFTIQRSSETELEIRSRVSNQTAQPISDLTFQLAVTKAYSLKLEPQSSRSLAPNQRDGITQIIRLQNCSRSWHRSQAPMASQP